MTGTAATDPGIGAADGGVGAHAPGAVRAVTTRAERHSPDVERPVYPVLGLPFDAVSMADAVERVRDAASSNTRCFISTPNLNFLMAARLEADFRDSVVQSDLSLADGMPIVWMARLLGVPIRERVPGSGLFERLLDHEGPPISVYFFGGPPGVAQAASERVNRRAGGLRCVGFESPGFGSVEEMSTDEQIGRINDSGAQFVIVSVGGSKGQAWIMRNRAHLTAPVLCNLGAVVNFAAGEVNRAPRWVQGIGFEWLWRIKEEPALWRRYWADGRRFLRLLATCALPSALVLRRRARPRDVGPVKLSVAHGPDRSTIELVGAWCHPDLPALRDALSRCARAGSQLVVDVTRVSFVDSAFVGLMLLARGAGDANRRFAIRGASADVTRTFEALGCAFLLDP